MMNGRRRTEMIRLRAPSAPHVRPITLSCTEQEKPWPITALSSPSPTASSCAARLQRPPSPTIENSVPGARWILDHGQHGATQSLGAANCRILVERVEGRGGRAHGRVRVHLPMRHKQRAGTCIESPGILHFSTKPQESTR